MARPRQTRPRPRTEATLSPRAQARLAAMRDELWRRYVNLAAIIERKRQARALMLQDPAPPAD